MSRAFSFVAGCAGFTLGLTVLAGLGLFGRRGCEAWREIGRREAGL